MHPIPTLLPKFASHLSIPSLDSELTSKASATTAAIKSTKRLPHQCLGCGNQERSKAPGCRRIAERRTNGRVRSPNGTGKMRKQCLEKEKANDWLLEVFTRSPACKCHFWQHLFHSHSETKAHPTSRSIAPVPPFRCLIHADLSSVKHPRHALGRSLHFAEPSEDFERLSLS